jgi:acetyl esterase/lipase
MVAISVEYRLSVDGLTPIDALDDVCAALAWAHENTSKLGIHEARIAAYGVSAGAHLAATTATVGCAGRGAGGDSRPDALLLWSPALDVTIDGWFRRLLRDRAVAIDYSPAQHVGLSTPPTSIVIGEEDTLTPLAGAERFCTRLVQRGQRCELHVYEGLGHLLTRNLANQESDFDPDPEARADGIAQHERFLVELGFIQSS